MRRYRLARRPVNIRITAETRAQSQKLKETGILTPESLPESCMFVQELCNNSLKYSLGTTLWEIAATEKALWVFVSGKSKYCRKESGLGRDTLRHRIERLGANFAGSVTKGGYMASVSLP